MPELFNWHANHRTFAGWLILSALTEAERVAGPEGRKKYFEDLAQATKGWTECQLTMQINGVEVPVMDTLNAIEQRLDQEIASAASKLLAEKTSLNGIMNAIQQAKHLLADELRKIGVTVEDD